MDHVDLLARYHHAPLSLDFASDCQLKRRQREEELRATPSLVVLCFFLLRTLWILFKHHHLPSPFAKGHHKAKRNTSKFQGSTVQGEPLCPSIPAVFLPSIYRSWHLPSAKAITAHIPAQAMPVAHSFSCCQPSNCWVRRLCWEPPLTLSQAS